MSKAIIVSKNRLTSAERIFKKTLVFDGVKRNTRKNHNDRIKLMMLINLDKSVSYDHLIMIENYNPAHLSMLALGESDYYFFDATPAKLKLLRQTCNELYNASKIMNMLRELSKIKMSKFLLQPFYELKMGTIPVANIKTESIIKDLTSYASKQYNLYFFVAMGTRDAMLVHQP